MEYALLVEADRLDHTRETDASYHQAKLTAAAFGEPERIWDEHREFRDSLISRSEPEPTMDRAAHLKLALSIQDRLVKAGILPREEIH